MKKKNSGAGEPLTPEELEALYAPIDGKKIESGKHGGSPVKGK